MTEVVRASTQVPRPSPRPGRLETRLRQELAALALTRPRGAALLLRLWHRPAWVLVPVSLAVGVVCGVLRQDGDQVRFRAAGLQMLGPHFFDVFSDSWLQVGPLYLVVLGALAWAARALHVAPAAVGPLAAGAHAVVITGVALAAVRQAARRTGAWVPRAQWVVVSVLVLGGVLSDALVADHPEELLLGVLLVLAATAADRGRLGGAAALLVLGMGIKQWAVTAAGLLLRGRARMGPSIRAGAFTALGVAALYLPFRLFGQLNTFEQRWKYAPEAWVAAVPALAHGGWAFRLLQGGAAAVAGGLVGLRARGSALVAVMVAIAVRLLLDPLRLTYYWGAFTAVALAWLWTTDARAVRWVRPPATVLATLLTFCTLVPHGLWWHAETVVALALPALALVVDRREARDPASPTTTADAIAEEPRRTTAIAL